jgi:hypothetical protein
MRTKGHGVCLFVLLHRIHLTKEYAVQFSQTFHRRMASSRMLHRVPLVGIDVSEERQFLQQAHGVTSQKTPFFILTAVKTSNLTDFPQFLILFTGGFIRVAPC